MKKQIRKFFSVFIICSMVLAGFGMTVFATGAGDASLSSLEVSPGELSPEFSSDRYEYRVEVEEDCDKLLVNAQTADSSAKAVIAGNSGLKAGENTVVISVTAADGSTTARYTIQVMRGDASGSPIGTQIGGGLASTPLITGAMSSPENREAEETENADPENGEGETEPETVREDDGNLEDGNVPGSGELPEETSGEEVQMPEGVITSAGRSYTLSVPDPALVPSGFEAAVISIGGRQVSAWQFPSGCEVGNMYLIYGTNQEGKTAFYIYDAAEGTVVTAAEGFLTIGQEEQILQRQLKSNQESYQTSLKNRMMIIIGLAVGCFILLIALTVSLTRKKHDEEISRNGKRKVSYDADRRPGRDLDEDFYEEYEEDEEEYDSFYEEEEEYDSFREEDEEDYDGFHEEEEEAYDEFYDDFDEEEEDSDKFYIEKGADAETKEFFGEKKKPDIENASRETSDWEDDTAPLPDLEDVQKETYAEEDTQEEAYGEDAYAEDTQEEAYGEEAYFEHLDLEDFDLEDSEPEVSESGVSEPETVEESDLKPEQPLPEEPEPEQPLPEDGEPEGFLPEENTPVDEGFEEIMLEDVAGDIQAIEIWDAPVTKVLREPEQESENLSWEGEATTLPEENWEGEKAVFPEENEEDEFALSEEDEELEDDFDLDAEFDLLDALLSDSVRRKK